MTLTSRNCIFGLYLILYFIPLGSSNEEIYPEGPVSLEYQLKRRLLRGYDVTSRPVRMDASVIDTVVGISLFHILETKWNDEYLNWQNDTEFNLTKIWIPAKNIWRPDLIISNYANDEYSEYMNTNAMVERDGTVLWMFPIVVKMYCTLDVRYFPFDVQECNMTMLSWTYNGFQINLKPQMVGNKIYYKPTNQQWAVTAIIPHLQIKRYTCCPEPFPVVTFSIHMHRRSLFYIINLICPCLLIYCVSFLGFFLPIESGEKINLEITVLLALVVFLLMISETMPPTPDAIPLVGLLFGITMVMVSIAVVMAVVVTNVYFRKASEPLPKLALKLAACYRERVHSKQRQFDKSNYGPSPKKNNKSAAKSNSKKVFLAAKKANERRIRMETLSLESLDKLPGTTSYSRSHKWDTLERINNHLVRPFGVPGNMVINSNSSKPAGVTSTIGNNSLYHTFDVLDHTELNSPPSPNILDDTSSTDSECDWHHAAFMLDVIFFWVFLFLTIAMFIIMGFIGYPAFTVTVYVDKNNLA